MNINKNFSRSNLLIVTLTLYFSFSQLTKLSAQNVAITDDITYKANGSAMLDVKSISKGFLVPRMTTAQRNTIINPANGLLVFDTDLKSFVFYSDSKWSGISYAGGLWSSGNKLVYLSDSSENVGIGTNSPGGKFEVKSNQGAGPDDPLFEVKDQDGNVVFGVYPSGVRIFFEEGNDKASKGGFAVGGRRRSTKGVITNYLMINEDSTRVYINDTTKASKGGFAVGGRRRSVKDSSTDILSINSDSVRIYINDSITNKASKGGFAVGGRRRSVKGSDGSSFMDMTSQNYFIGHQSGQANTSGLYNSFMGYQCGKTNSMGSSNVFMGYNAGISNIKGSSNVFLGYQTGYKNKASWNSFIGFQAGYNNTTGYLNSFIGYWAGYSNTSGNLNTFLGYNAGYGNTSGYDNVYMGTNAGASDSAGNGNVCIGSKTGGSMVSGADNTFIGRDAGTYFSSGGSNTYVGSSSGANQNSGNGNVYLGCNAGMRATGDNNISIGYMSGCASLGSNNILFGYFAGYDFTSPPNNTLIIENSRNVSTPLIGGDFASRRVGILRMPTTYELEVGGSIWANGTVYASDLRWKKNVATLDNVLDKVMNIRAVSYNWRMSEFPEKNFTNDRQIGVIAQELETIFPELVQTDKEGFKSVSYEKLGPILVKAIEEQQQIIESQNNKIGEMSVKISTQNAKIESLQSQIDELKNLIIKK